MDNTATKPDMVDATDSLEAISVFKSLKNLIYPVNLTFNGLDISMCLIFCVQFKAKYFQVVVDNAQWVADFVYHLADM